MEREEDRRGEGIHLFRIQIVEKRGTRGACESQEGGGGDKAGMGDKQMEVHGRVGEKNLAMQEVGGNGDGVRCRSIWVERGEGGRGNARKVDQMDARSGLGTPGYLVREKLVRTYSE